MDGITAFALPPTGFGEIELARGYFERMTISRGGLHVSGWLLLPHTEFDHLSVYWNGALVGAAVLQSRPDLATAFPWIEHAGRSGFSFVSDSLALARGTLGRLDLIGFGKDGSRGRMSTLVREDLDAVPTPPAGLMERVAHTTDVPFFKIGGLKSFGEFLDPIQRHSSSSSIRSMLDWGCGCGRVTTHFLDYGVPEVFGCDIDREAIAWCSENLPRGKFLHIEPLPPTSYANSAFDLVIGYSVFTHLRRDVQAAWLREMRRVIRPGGLFLASTHGEFAASFTFAEAVLSVDVEEHRAIDKLRARVRELTRGTRGRRLSNIVAGVRETLAKDGIADEMSDHTLDGVAPRDYYRGVFQTQDYTVREWSRFFEVIEYVEAGIGNFQDLVVMRRPG